MTAKKSAGGGVSVPPLPQEDVKIENDVQMAPADDPTARAIKEAEASIGLFEGEASAGGTASVLLKVNEKESLTIVPEGALKMDPFSPKSFDAGALGKGVAAESESIKGVMAAIQDQFGPLSEPLTRGELGQALADFTVAMRNIIKSELAARASDFTVAAVEREGVTASLPGSLFACPECGLAITGPSLTAQAGGMYEHAFGESRKLPGGQRCQYQGRKFKPPTVFLELEPLTTKKQ